MKKIIIEAGLVLTWIQIVRGRYSCSHCFETRPSRQAWSANKMCISTQSFSTCLLVNPKLSNLTWQYCSSTGNLAAKYSNTKRQCLFAWLNWARPVEVHVASDVEIKSAGISDHAVIVDSQGGRLGVIGWGANCFCLKRIAHSNEINIMFSIVE